jgi:hypothetical protein
MTTVLLGMAWLDAFDTNAKAKAKPPDRQLAQVEQSMRRSEGYAVVAANVGGQAALLKKPLKHCESVVSAGRRKRLTSEEKTAGRIGDGERIAVVVISQQELSLVVGAPELIGTLAQR